VTNTNYAVASLDLYL